MATVLALDTNAYGHENVVEQEEGYPAEFLSWLQQEESNARDEAVDEQRQIALSFYNGEPFGDEEEGRSQIVTRDVAEVIDYMIPSVLRTMISGDRIVEFEALDSANKDALEEATEAVSQQFMQEQDGFRILHDSLKAGLLEKTGQIKSYVEVEKKRQQRDVSLEELLAMQEQVELTEAEPLDETETQWRVAWVEETPRFIDEPLANEEFGCAKDARSVKKSAYYHHKVRKTLSELKEMGFDTDLIGFQDGGYSNTKLERARDGDADTQEVYRDGPMRSVWLLEEYCRYDLNGDGIAEFLRVSRVGTAILEVEEITYGLINEWCPYPMQHRRIGHSLADKVMDIQRVRSVLMRQALDNLYQSNAPRVLVHENGIGTTTIDDLLTVRPAGIVRWKGAVKPEPFAVPFVAGDAFKANEILIGDRESRTGITRLNQGLDAEAMNKTATGTALMQASGQQIEEFIARNFVEFISNVFELKYRLMKDYGKPFSIIIDGQPKKVDPSQWPDEMRVVTRVGLGTGRKEQRVQYRMMMLEIQKEAMMAGLPNVGPQQIFNSVKGLTADLSLGQGTDYFMDPATMEPQEPKPDPEMAKVQGEAALKMKKQQDDAEERARRDALDQQEQQAKLDRQRWFDDQEMAQKEARAVAEAQLALRKQDDQKELAIRQQDIEAELALRSAANKPDGDNTNISSNRPGGDLSQ